VGLGDVNLEHHGCRGQWDRRYQGNGRRRQWPGVQLIWVNIFEMELISVKFSGGGAYFSK
jgi:hypothetical protein